ncbi:MAG: hypothetical protein LBC12_07100 [Nitrososphaerota archaeon]|nr:hypothetical protein [Nitrososphaerota archaeon]
MSEFVEFLGKLEVWQKELVGGRFVEGNRQFYDWYFVVDTGLGGGGGC